jgi:hypothetical protein
MENDQVLTMRDVKKLHKEKFGVEPVITGVNFHLGTDRIIDRILKSIEDGIPYIEEEVPPGTFV